MKAKLKNVANGVIVEVHSIKKHPSCSYGKAIWVDDDNTPYIQVGIKSPLYEIEITDHNE